MENLRFYQIIMNREKNYVFYLNIVNIEWENFFLIWLAELSSERFEFRRNRLLHRLLNVPYGIMMQNNENDANENRKMLSAFYGKLIVESLSHLFIEYWILIWVSTAHPSDVRTLNIVVLNVPIIAGNWSPEIKRSLHAKHYKINWWELNSSNDVASRLLWYIRHIFFLSTCRESINPSAKKIPTWQHINWIVKWPGY